MVSFFSRIKKRPKRRIIMIYYFKDTHQLRLCNDFILPVTDERNMKKDWIARFWTIDYFFKNDNNDLIYHSRYSVYYRQKNQAIQKLLNRSKGDLYPILTLHILDRYHYEWLEFYEVDVLNDGRIKTKKLPKKHARFKKDHHLVDEKGNPIPVNMSKYLYARMYREDRALADSYGEINRFRIIQKDRLDIFHDRFEYFGVNDGFAKTDNEPSKENQFYNLLKELYEKVFLKSFDDFDASGGCIMLDALNESGFICKYFPKDYFPVVKAILSKYISAEFIPTFLSDDIETKAEDWWKPITFYQKPDGKKVN